ncbi:MAG: DUF6067 family protein, partial [Armatimonadetes bacterium]|nr:DUF6067 family protein [Armatimonadota bacterium]
MPTRRTPLGHRYVAGTGRWSAIALAAVIPAFLAAEEGAAPRWLTDQTYDTYASQDRVLKPWTPVQVGDRRIAVWGRVTTWRPESILPASITSQGVELLAEPMRLVITRGGQEHFVPLQHWRVTEQKKSAVSIVARGRVAGVSTQADILAEYDGFMLITLKFPDTAGDVDAVHIVAGMPAATTTLYQTFARPMAGWIGDSPIKLAWMSGESQPVENLEHWSRSFDPIANFYHWLGNEDRGLGFAYTTLEHWAPETENAFCTIFRSADKRRVIYTINLVERPVSLAGRTFQIGLQATPIKPLPPDYHSMLTTSWRWEDWAALQQFPDNIDVAIIWPPGIMRGLNDPYHINAEALERHVKHCHERGVAALFSGCPQKISPFSEEFEAWKEEWLNLPESVLDWEGAPHYQNCGRPYSLRKWLFYGWAKEVVERFGLEGIYYDGWQAGTMAC